MTGLIARFLRDATAPVGGALFRAIIALALVVMALGALSSALVIANFWLYVWLKTMITPLQALGALIGAWALVAIIALIAALLVLRRSKATLTETPTPTMRETFAQATAPPPGLSSLADQVDAMVDPLAKTLAAMGFRGETTALLAGAQAFKTLRTSQLSALALIVGYAAARAMSRKS